jgi:hypothetical protein
VKEVPGRTRTPIKRFSAELEGALVCPLEDAVDFMRIDRPTPFQVSDQVVELPLLGLQILALDALGIPSTPGKRLLCGEKIRAYGMRHLRPPEPVNENETVGFGI